MVAKWLSRWAHNPKVRGSKPRYALFFFYRDSMAEWIRRLTTDQEIPGSSPGRVEKIFFFTYKTLRQRFYTGLRTAHASCADCPTMVNHACPPPISVHLSLFVNH